LRTLGSLNGSAPIFMRATPVCAVVIEWISMPGIYLICS
jgi:hypothetical protein